MTVEVCGIKIHETIKSNDHYKLCVATIPDSTTPVYSVIHVKYGVAEMSTSILANGKKMFDMFTGWEEHPETLEQQGMLPEVVPPEFLS